MCRVVCKLVTTSKEVPGSKGLGGQEAALCPYSVRMAHRLQSGPDCVEEGGQAPACPPGRPWGDSVCSFRVLRALGWWLLGDAGLHCNEQGLCPWNPRLVPGGWGGLAWRGGRVWVSLGHWEPGVGRCSLLAWGLPLLVSGPWVAWVLGRLLGISRTVWAGRRLGIGFAQQAPVSPARILEWRSHW